MAMKRITYMGSRYSYWIKLSLFFFFCKENKPIITTSCQNMQIVIYLIREQQKLLKALEKLDAEPRYSVTQSGNTDYCKQWVSQ